ncbi:FMN-binding protein MioC [Shewanella chilikensis]|uniref:FMN-binding protein MioC n=1 Tax=Shewanella chilikensis TaxID=558541 RepID=UPI00201017B5|nr:FMN-binding protein MioC [Shewanella chilikensis]MCL1163657.1 FMN-binding protein MioC [Shewanella chilikensis]
MAKVEVLVGTTLGGAEYVAEELINKLKQNGHQTNLYLTPQLDQLDPKALWLIVSSTHGAGDLPDNLQPFYQELLQSNQNLQDCRYALCAIGDSSYDTFCQGPEKLLHQLSALGAQSYVDKIQIDVQYDPVPEDPALAWLDGWLGKL